MSRSFHPRKPKKPQPIRGKVSKSKVIKIDITFVFSDLLYLKIVNLLKAAKRNQFITNWLTDWYNDDCKESKCKSYTCGHNDHIVSVYGPPGAGYKTVVNNLKKLIS